jgi:5-(carboxyamino)imidazole ribonucleotide mutase
VPAKRTPAPVAVIMGSQSDWQVMQHAAAILDELEVGHDERIVSAHRTPERLYDFARGAQTAGYKVIIAGAGGAAHLPGMTAALTVLPVFAVPVESRRASAASTACCPSSRCRPACRSEPWPSASRAR